MSNDAIILFHIMRYIYDLTHVYNKVYYYTIVRDNFLEIEQGYQINWTHALAYYVSQVNYIYFYIINDILISAVAASSCGLNTAAGLTRFRSPPT